MARQGEARLLLVRHAVALLEEVGLAGFTGREVARRAGVSHGAPRRHFPTLAALLAAVAASGFEDLHARLARTRDAEAATTDDQAGTTYARVLRLARCYLAFARERPAMFELMFRHDLLEDSGEHLREHSGPVFELVLATVAEAGAPSGREPLPLTVDLWAGVHGVAVLASRRALEVMTPDDPDELLVRQLRAHLGEP